MPSTKSASTSIDIRPATGKLGILVPGLKDRFGIVIAVAAAVLAGACGSGSSTGGDVTATIGGMSWRTAAEGFVVPGLDDPTATTFTLQGATLLPNSPLIDSSKPVLTIFFSQVPGVGTYTIDGVTVNVEYEVDVNTIYSGSNGSVQVASISTSRAQGSFEFELQSPIANPMMLAVTDGAFDVPVSAN